MHLEYPKWIDAPKGNPGHPQNPGKVLVESEDQEREVLAGGEPPRDLNPEPAPGSAASGEKPIDDMNREELISVLVRESITADVTDEQLRESIHRLRDHVAGKDAGEPLTDAAGEKVPPPQDQEANKGKDDAVEGRTLPEAKPEPATDARPDEAKEKVADDKPSGNITEAAATPPEAPKGTKPKAK